MNKPIYKPLSLIKDMDTDAQNYGSDFIVARELRLAVLRALDDKRCESSTLDANTPTSCRDALPDGRKVVVYFPHGSAYMRTVLTKSYTSEYTTASSEQSTSTQEPSSSEDASQKDRLQLYFVLFVGYKKDFSHGQDLSETSWDLDTGLKNDMVAIEEILSYSSCERTVGGDWTNLVVFTSLSVLDKWQDSPLHKAAVRDFSPQFYSKLRIHRGQIDGEFKDGVFNLQRTLFLDYEKANQTTDRQEKYWNNSESSTSYNPVQFKC